MRTKLHLIAIAVIITNSLFAQEKTVPKNKRELIQFSGVVIEGDSLRPVPFTSIIVRNSNRGTISDYFGYFSFVAQKLDTIEFSAIGYNEAVFVIPDTLSTNKYSLIQVLRNDTVNLKVTEIFPWPSREQFKQAFLALNLPEDDMTRAEKNMDRAEMKDRMTGMAMDASLNYKYTMQQYQSKLYYAGQLPPNNLLNPIAWAKFIQAWKNGDFGKKKTKK
ncbi:MAG: carboxypeptidase-like regulatory domain-containing protein [Bacteroidetes bacterium]|nr:carboxypeptidase-like regulatory domain-containing protein [Bacteroidota bacterium]